MSIVNQFYSRSTIPAKSDQQESNKETIEQFKKFFSKNLCSLWKRFMNILVKFGVYFYQNSEIFVGLVNLARSHGIVVKGADLQTRGHVFDSWCKTECKKS